MYTWVGHKSPHCKDVCMYGKDLSAYPGSLRPVPIYIYRGDNEMDRIPKGSLTMGPAESTSLPPGEQLLSTKRPVHSVRMRKDYGGPGPLVLQAEGRPREEGVDARKHIPLCK